MGKEREEGEDEKGSQPALGLWENTCGSFSSVAVSTLSPHPFLPHPHIYYPTQALASPLGHPP